MSRRAKECMENAKLLPGLPWHLALECLARVPLRSLWGVCNAWQDVLYTHIFRRLRSGLGMPPFRWLYTLVHADDGVLRWHAYDPLACTWHPLPPMPDDVEFQLTGPGYILGRLHAVQCVSTSGGKLVVVAGSRAEQQAEDGSGRLHLQPALDRPLVFEAVTRRWSRGSPFRVPRKWCVCGAVGDKVYVASGCGVEWDVGVSKRAETYDVEAETWSCEEALRSSKFSGEAISAVNVGDKLHMVSGRGVMMKEGVVYDVASRVWSRMRPGLHSGWTGPCTAISGRFYAVEESCGRLKVYDSEEDSWDTVVESKLLRGLSQLAASGGKICGIVAGGEKRIVVVDVDVAGGGNKILEVEIPMGRPVAIEVLERMGKVR